MKFLIFYLLGLATPYMVKAGAQMTKEIKRRITNAKKQREDAKKAHGEYLIRKGFEMGYTKGKMDERYLSARPIGIDPEGVRPTGYITGRQEESRPRAYVLKGANYVVHN